MGRRTFAHSLTGPGFDERYSGDIGVGFDCAVLVTSSTATGLLAGAGFMFAGAAVLLVARRMGVRPTRPSR